MERPDSLPIAAGEVRPLAAASSPRSGTRGRRRRAMLGPIAASLPVSLVLARFAELRKQETPGSGIPDVSTAHNRHYTEMRAAGAHSDTRD